MLVVLGGSCLKGVLEGPSALAHAMIEHVREARSLRGSAADAQLRSRSKIEPWA